MLAHRKHKGCAGPAVSVINAPRPHHDTKTYQKPFSIPAKGLSQPNVTQQITARLKLLRMVLPDAIRSTRKRARRMLVRLRLKLTGADHATRMQA